MPDLLSALVDLLNGMTGMRRPDQIGGSFPADRELTAQPGGVTPFATLPTFGAAPAAGGMGGAAGMSALGGTADTMTPDTPGLGPKKAKRLTRKANRLERREGRLEKRLGRLEGKKQTKPRVAREHRIEQRITSMQNRVGRIRHRVG